MVLATTWGAMQGAHGARSGVVRTNWGSLWSPKGEYWCQPSRIQHSCKVEDLALGMDCDTPLLFTRRHNLGWEIGHWDWLDDISSDWLIGPQLGRYGFK